ncbi:MAG: ParA family protein [Desulfobacterales bacterium]|nr:ParA family protein [Desulfobacterales bacterium]
MDIDLKGVVVIVGNYGSGKTEVAVNLGIKRKRDGVDVLLADLDLVNPYFRSREACSQLADLGIEVILPPRKYHNADLPILSPKVGGLIRKPAALSILDAGGDGVGTRVLAALADMFRESPVEMLQVVNPFRPFTSDVEGCLVMRDRIEAASRLKVTGLVGNAHLLDETRADDIIKGYALVTDVSRASGLPVVFITASADLMPAVESSGVTCPILPIERQMVPPWKAAAEPDR